MNIRCAILKTCTKADEPCMHQYDDFDNGVAWVVADDDRGDTPLHNCEEGMKAGSPKPVARPVEPLRAEDRKWTWTYNEEECYGPFDTRDDALADALGRSEDEGFRHIGIGRCSMFDPLGYAPDATDLLEAIEERAFDNEFSFYEDQILSIKGDRGKACAALKAALSVWMDKWVNVETVWTMVDEEKVDLAEIDE